MTTTTATLSRETVAYARRQAATGEHTVTDLATELGVDYRALLHAVVGITHATLTSPPHVQAVRGTSLLLQAARARDRLAQTPLCGFGGRTQTRVEMLAADLRRRVTTGELLPGHVFTGEGLQRQYPWCRWNGEITDALDRLRDEGLIETRSRLGSRVKPTDPAQWWTTAEHGPTLAAHVDAVLRARIRDGVTGYTLSAKIPSCEELAEEFGISPKTAHNATRALKQEGALTAHRPLGTFVTGVPAAEAGQ